MEGLRLYDPEDGLKYEAPELTDEETLEYLVKVFSRSLVECRIEDIEQERVRDSYCEFPRAELPTDVKRLIDLDHRMKNPEFMGRVMHLASHIRHTRFHEHIAAQENPKRDLFWWLEDLRAERNYLLERNLDTFNFHHSWAEQIKGYESVTDPTALDLSVMYIMTVARVHTGAFLKKESDAFRVRFLSKMPENVLDEFDALIEQYLELDDHHDGVSASLLVQKWLEMTDGVLSEPFRRECMDGSPVDHLVGDESMESMDTSDATPTDSPSGEGSDDQEGAPEPEDATPQEGDSEDSDNSPVSEDTPDADTNTDESDQQREQQPSEGADTSSEKQESKDSLLQDSDSILDDGEVDEDVGGEEFEPQAFDPEKYEQKKAEDEARNRSKMIADKVFPKDALKYTSRPPTAEDNTLASSLVVTFRKARWRAPSKTIKTSKTPPGKLSSRAAVTSAAQRSMGIPVTAEPFRQVIRKRVEGPPPIVGMACDVSGSMTASVQPMAQIMWACSRAIPRVGGKFAAVSFGQTVKALIPPGARPNQVPVFQAKDGYEEAFGAISALTGGLNLLGNVNGVKILIISSDGMWQADQREASVALLKRLERHGVHVFWITFQNEFLKGRRMPRYMPADYSIPFLEVGSVLEFQKASDVPRELGKLISQKVEQG